MSKENLVEKFNEMFPVGSLCYWRSVASERAPYEIYTISSVARVQNGQAVAFFLERGGMVSIEEKFVDYTRKPAPEEKQPLENYDLCEHFGPRAKVKLRRRCASCQLEVDKNFDSFWRKLIYPNGELDVEEMKGDLNDYSFLMEQASIVYDHITGGQLSKTNYFAETVIQQADKHLQPQIDEAVKEATENLREDLQILENCVDCVRELFGYPKDDIIDFVTFIPQDFNKMKDEISRLKIALADAIRRPMGVLPASAEGLITEKDLREAEARRTNKPRLDAPCAECGQPVGSDYTEVGEGEDKFIVCGECECATQEGWEMFKDEHRKGNI